jgi:hypothetical protein
VSANGLAGTVATPTTTPAITLSTTITGLLKGNGTAISAATAGTDYMTPGNVSAAYQPIDTGLTALSSIGTGIVTNTAADTFTPRTITGTANRLTVSNGNGVSAIRRSTSRRPMTRCGSGRPHPYGVPSY